MINSPNGSQAVSSWGQSKNTSHLLLANPRKTWTPSPTNKVADCEESMVKVIFSQQYHSITPTLQCVPIILLMTVTTTTVQRRSRWPFVIKGKISIKDYRYTWDFEYWQSPSQGLTLYLTLLFACLTRATHSRPIIESITAD